MSTERALLPDSTRPPAPGVRALAPIDPAQRIEVTLVLRRKAALTAQAVVDGTSTTADLGERFGADPADVDAVTAALPGVEVLAVDLASRRMRVGGRADELSALFGAELTRVTSVHATTGARVEHRHREGALSVPAQLDGILVAVLGLDDRPQASPRLRMARVATSTSYTPLQLESVYSMPAGADGTGQTVAILELGGGADTTEIAAYFTGLGITGPSVTLVSVDGAGTKPRVDTDADGEVQLDIEVAGAIAPRADMVVYFAPNTDAGFLDALSTAAHATPTPAAISISWGGSEDSWTGMARRAFDDACADAAAMGITITAAAGDNGSGDGATDGRTHADFPASSPHVLACGGTSLRINSTGAVTSETVWNDGAGRGATGGAISDTFGLPTWQAKADVPKRANGGAGRGVPDVAAVADPETGYQIAVNGQKMVIGGTSAVAPLWAGLVCRLAQSVGSRLGLLQPTLYAATTGFRDITEGSNGAYSAAPGWDACTGLGVPVGTDLLTALQSGGAAKA